MFFKRAFLLAFALFNTPLFAQQVDSSKVDLQRLLEQIRQLESRVHSLESEIAQLKYARTDSTIEQLITAMNEDSEEDIDAPEDQRSRRKRIDSLLRAFTNRPGVLYFNGSAVSILQWNPGENSFNTFVGLFDLFAHTQLGSSTLLFLDLQTIGGADADKYISSLAPVNDVAGSTQDVDGLDRINVLEAWVEFTAFQQAITITAGKIDLTNYFDNNAVANDETSQFYSAAFVNSAALPTPDNSPGLRLRTSLADKAYLQLGFASSDNSGDRIAEELFAIASSGFRFFHDMSYEANLRIYGYVDGANEDGKGVGLSYDQMIFGEKLTVFGRWGQNQQSLAEKVGIKSAWSAGLRYIRRFGAGNRRMIFGAAYGEIRPAHGEQVERIAEAYYRQQVNRWVFFSPHIQFVFRPGEFTVENTVLGFRSQLSF